MKITRTVTLGERIRKTGRNEPCSCGSGRKYKKCCLGKEVSFPSGSKRSGLIPPLLDWATAQDWYSSCLETALVEIFGKNKKEMNQDEAQALSEVILFEHKVKNKKTPLELFYRQADLSDDKKQLYKSWIDNAEFGAWEALEIFLGKGMKVRRFLEKEEFLVSERLGSYSLKVGRVFVSRMLPYPGGLMFGGGLMAELPESWIYLFKKHKMPFEFSQIEFMKLWFREDKESSDFIPKKSGYGALKKELIDFVIQNELPFDFKNFDERLKKAKHPTAFFYSIFACVGGNEKLMKRARDLTFEIWKSVSDDTELEQGTLENVLISDFIRQVARIFEKENVSDFAKQSVMSKKLLEKWLNKPQKNLKGKTPKEAILDERVKLGDNRKTFDFSASAIIWSKSWNKASWFHKKGLEAFRKRNFEKARESFTEVVKNYSDFPFIFKAYANLGISEFALGNKELAVKNLKKAIEINPHYKFAKEKLKRISRLSQKRVDEIATSTCLELSATKLIAKIKKTQSRKRKKRS
ncbi:tetratricopeptide repeat protein [Patescibacteria group bacterium]|nr:tetratricopeptide repeat protein [Patescibacteria group bacterium]